MIFTAVLAIGVRVVVPSANGECGSSVDAFWVFGDSLGLDLILYSLSTTPEAHRTVLRCFLGRLFRGDREPPKSFFGTRSLDSILWLEEVCARGFATLGYCVTGITFTRIDDCGGDDGEWKISLGQNVDGFRC